MKFPGSKRTSPAATSPLVLSFALARSHGWWMRTQRRFISPAGETNILRRPTALAYIVARTVPYILVHIYRRVASANGKLPKWIEIVPQPSGALGEGQHGHKHAEAQRRASICSGLECPDEPSPVLVPGQFCGLYFRSGIATFES